MSANLRLRDAAFGYHPTEPDEPAFAAGVCFVTLRLSGSLPEAMAAGACASGQPREPAERDLARFRETERVLDGAGQGPVWLTDPHIASMVCGGLHHGDGLLYRLHRYVVMPNHIHALIRPLAVDGSGSVVPSVASIIARLSRFTTDRANQLLGRRGAFWQADYLGYGVRDAGWYARFSGYIDANPVLAGLCATPEQWPWSSAGEAAA